MKRIYKPLSKLSDEEIKHIIHKGTIEEMILLPLSIGEYHSNWKEAQDLCVQLSFHKDERVKANAALGLAYIARTKGKLEKYIVKPILLRLLKECDEYKWRVIDSIEDINIYMNWEIGKKALSRIKNKRNS